MLHHVGEAEVGVVEAEAPLGPVQGGEHLWGRQEGWVNGIGWGEGYGGWEMEWGGVKHCVWLGCGRCKPS